MTDIVMRFVSPETHPPFGYRTGVFRLAYELREASPPDAPFIADIARHLGWFETNLAIPSRFSVSRHPRAQETALSWIKAAATEHVDHLRTLVALMAAASHIQIEEVRTTRPGYVVFEDDHQVVALPFADTPT